MTLPAFIILVLLFLLLVYIYAQMARYPGQKARERGHPQAEAIAVLSWVGLLLGAVPWVIALVWAHTNPAGPMVRVAAGEAPAAPAATVPTTSADEEEK